MRAIVRAEPLDDGPDVKSRRCILKSTADRYLLVLLTVANRKQNRVMSDENPFLLADSQTAAASRAARRGDHGVNMKTVLYEMKDNVARITLNRPDEANSINLEMALELMHASIQASESPAVRAVIITGAGKMFSGGGDLKSFAAQEDRLPAHLKELALYLHAAISRLVRMDAPLLVAVNGSAGGAGMSLCLFADLVLAAESAKFTLAYTRAGLSPDGGATYYLPRIIGVRRALELALTNRVLTPREAQDWGIVTRVVPDSELQAEALALAGQLASGATRAFGAARRLLHHSFAESLETQMELEAQAIADQARTHDAREGIAAFIAKRKPAFSGS